MMVAKKILNTRWLKIASAVHATRKQIGAQGAAEWFSDFLTIK